MTEEPSKKPSYDDQPVWKLYLLWFKSVVTPGNQDWQQINAAIERKTGSGRPPKRNWP